VTGMKNMVLVQQVLGAVDVPWAKQWISATLVAHQCAPSELLLRVPYSAITHVWVESIAMECGVIAVVGSMLVWRPAWLLCRAGAW